MNKALSGIRVLDFTQVLAGPFCTMNLADFGAEVIKIEKPGTGDGSRIFGPFINGQSGYYTLVNRGKKGVAIDLKKGRDIIYEMVRNCDIVVENFKPGVMEKLGYSYEQLKKVNPEIIYCSISGFGQDSPMRDLPAYDTTIEEKLNAIATKVYRADGVVITAAAKKQIQQLTELGFDKMPICMAKTQFSFSDDASKLGAPRGFKITVREVKVNAGAGFLVAKTGDIMTMPGLPKVPSAEKIDIDDNGVISGLF